MPGLPYGSPPPVSRRVPPHSRLTPPVRRVPPTDEHLSLLELVQLAERVGGSNHGFTYIQLPVSAGMPEAWSQTWQMVERSGSGGVAGGTSDPASGSATGGRGCARRRH